MRFWYWLLYFPDNSQKWQLNDSSFSRTLLWPIICTATYRAHSVKVTSQQEMTLHLSSTWAFDMSNVVGSYPVYTFVN